MIMNNEKKQNAHDWARELGAEIIDPDGWRNEGRSMDEAITKAEFDRMINQSTINSRGYPSFLGDTTFKIGVDPK